ncbi:energy transducer TonB [Undibacterium amnicola]|uniref:Protein TonB n=1 Tax=Undibacterium amnicola TaxID=1834038 RepID=A0ABR6XTD4_9BURK|nr:energy transducer TonB [Undibacterium amnicola]MBC3832701.1 energy transducer TonB [Undibacterium amnicola]
MSSLTFESAGVYHRRAVVRRQYQAHQKVATKQNVTAAAVALIDASTARRQAEADVASKSKRSLAILTSAIFALHAYGYYWISQPGNKEALAKFSPMTIEIAPPPPVEKPKPPEPKLVKVVPQKALPIPDHVPVVNTPAETVSSSANTVAVAVAPPPAPPAPPPAPEPVTEPRGFAGYKNNPAPNYPAVAQRRGLEGTVVLRVKVLATGFPDDVQVSKSSGHIVLDEAAIKAVLSWTFDPAKRGKTPIDGVVSVPIIFKI